MKKMYFLILILSFIFPFSSAFGDDIANGSCAPVDTDSTCVWSVSDDGVLTISGNGAMADFNWNSPWSAYNSSISKIDIVQGITNIGNTAFANTLATEVNIPNTVENIGDYAFLNSNNLTDIIFPESVTSIGDYAFQHNRLVNIIIPSSITNIGRGAFDHGYNIIDNVTFCEQTQLSSVCDGTNYQFTNMYTGQSVSVGYYVDNKNGTLSFYDDMGNHIVDDEGNPMIKNNPWTNKIDTPDGYKLYDSKGKYLGNFDHNGNIFRRTSYTIKEANDATPDSNGEYSVRLSF